MYYVIYNPQYWKRDQHQPFEVYKLINGEYQLQIGEPFWMPEVGLGIGRANYISGKVQREVLYWYNETGTRYLTPHEAAQSERQHRSRLEAKLRELGINPDNI